MSFKNVMLGISLSLMTSVMLAQESYTAEAEGWLVDVEEAYKISQETGKPILANFTGSDWCGWCKRLKASVFVHDEFKQWADENVVLLELDFPRRKQIPEKFARQNQGLQRAFNVRGFPTVWLFDLEWDGEANQFGIKAHGKTGYTKTAGEFTANIDKMLAKREADPKS